MLAALGLSHLALDSPAAALSDGYKRRLALAVQLTRGPQLLLLDEPLAGLDWRARADIAALLGARPWSLPHVWTCLKGVSGFSVLDVPLTSTGARAPTSRPCWVKIPDFKPESLHQVPSACEALSPRVRHSVTPFAWAAGQLKKECTLLIVSHDLRELSPLVSPQS